MFLKEKKIQIQSNLVTDHLSESVGISYISVEFLVLNDYLLINWKHSHHSHKHKDSLLESMQQIQAQKRS